MTENPMTTVPPTTPAPASGDVVRDQDKIMLVLSYLGILALIPLLTVKDSEYVKWHAKQGLALAIVWFAWTIVGGILNIIPWVGCFLGFAGHILLLVVTIMAIVKAFEPNRWKIPVVSAIAEKF